MSGLGSQINEAMAESLDTPAGRRRMRQVERSVEEMVQWLAIASGVSAVICQTLVGEMLIELGCALGKVEFEPVREAFGSQVLEMAARMAEPQGDA